MTIALMLLIGTLQADEPTTAATDDVVAPSGRRCPSHAPIKGNLTTHSGESCIYHRPSGAYYRETRPERCYVTEAAAREAGCRPSHY